MKKIICKIDRKTGIMSIESQGHVGSSCLNDPHVTKLKEGLGMTDAPTTMTEEFYNTTDQVQKLEGQ
jgi:hypothetical protein